MRSRPEFDLFLVSWLVLFLELACIRWFPSHVMFLTFFTNIVLLACFVGMSVGCLAARSKTDHLARTPIWLAGAVGIGMLVNLFQGKLLRYVAIGDQANPDVIFFGAEAGDLYDPGFRLPVEVVAGGFFLLIATLLVGPGQEMGRAFNRVPNRNRAYSLNLLGSLAGIASFAACSYLELPSVVWFAAVALGVGYFVFRDAGRPAGAGPAPAARPFPTTPILFLAVAVAITVITSGLFNRPGQQTIHWSPYYRVDFYPGNLFINTNLVSHQVIEPREKVPAAAYANYALPYLLRRDLAGPDGRSPWPEFRRVLIIGAGSGNDVSRALEWLPPDARIDAVEIDPVIQRIGAAHHPNKPYQDPRVHVVLNDGRNFLRRADPETYDLVVFALVDSLVLHSGYSNLRLESYLFTEQSFKDVRRALKPTGLCAVYNYFRHGWLAARIRDELRAAFGVDPAVFQLTDEPTDNLTLDRFDPHGFTAFLAGSDRVIGPLRRKFEENGNWYWVPGDRAFRPDTPAHFGPTKPGPLPPPEVPPPADHPTWKPKDWVGLRVAKVEEPDAVRPPLRRATDDWPFLYVRQPGIPLVTWRGMAMMLVLSVVLWFLFRPRERVAEMDQPPDWSLMGRSFFLGAGFMLVETKAVVHMALLFGSTWMVNTVVFAAVLLMSLAGNLFAGKFRPRRLEPYYVGLLVTLGLGLAIPLDAFLGLDRTTQVLGACALVFAPIAFAGVIFATTFGRTSQPDRVFGANVAGALIGGLSENASVILGFQYLLCVAIGFYLLSAAFGNRTVPTPQAGNGV